MNSSLALIWTITAATTLLQAGNGLLQALMPLRMQAEGLSVSSIGIVAAAYGLGFSTGCFLAPSFIRHVGYIRAFASLAAIYGGRRRDASVTTTDYTTRTVR